MANITIEKKWRPNVFEWGTSTPALGGPIVLDSNGDPDNQPNGIANAHAKQLADRTEFIKWRVASSGPNFRNSVLNGRLNAAGEPNFIDGVNDEIFADATDPFVATIAGGFDEHGQVDYYIFFASAQAITAGVGTGVEGVYIGYDPVTDVVSVFSSTDLISIGPDEPNTGTYKYWYHPFLGKTFEWTGAAWEQVYLLYCGVIDYGTNSATSLPPGVDWTGGPEPAGKISVYSGLASNIPAGYLLCNGQAVKRKGYNRLFKAVGTTYGVGDGSTTFNVPELRGYFIRGLNESGSGEDPSRALGSTQQDGVGPHAHEGDPSGAEYGHFHPTGSDLIEANATPSATTREVSFGTETGLAGTDIIAETRPVNKAFHYIIKI